MLFKNELRKKKDKKEQNSAYLSQQDVSFRESRDRMVNCQTTWFEKPEFQVWPSGLPKLRTRYPPSGYRVVHSSNCIGHLTPKDKRLPIKNHFVYGSELFYIIKWWELKKKKFFHDKTRANIPGSALETCLNNIFSSSGSGQGGILEWEESLQVILRCISLTLPSLPPSAQPNSTVRHNQSIDSWTWSGGQWPFTNLFIFALSFFFRCRGQLKNQMIL